MRRAAWDKTDKESAMGSTLSLPPFNTSGVPTQNASEGQRADDWGPQGWQLSLQTADRPCQCMKRSS